MVFFKQKTLTFVFFSIIINPRPSDGNYHCFFFCVAAAMCDQVQNVEFGTLRFLDPVSY